MVARIQTATCGHWHDGHQTIELDGKPPEFVLHFDILPQLILISNSASDTQILSETSVQYTPLCQTPFTRVYR